MQGGGPLYSHGRGNQGAVGVIGLMFPDKPDKHLIFFDLLLSDPYRPAGFLSEIVGD